MISTVLTKRPLTANESYTQGIRDRFNDRGPIDEIRGLVYADKAGTLYLEESDDDGETYSTTIALSVSAGTTTELAWTSLTKRWYRFKYTNGAATQAKFVLAQQYRGMSTLQVGGVTLTATNVGIDQTTPGSNNVKLADSIPAGTNEIGSVQLSGSYVEIGGVSFAVSGGDTIRGKAADKPTPAAAHAAIPYCYYFAVDTGMVEVADGTNWVVI